MQNKFIIPAVILGLLLIACSENKTKIAQNKDQVSAHPNVMDITNTIIAAEELIEEEEVESSRRELAANEVDLRKYDFPFIFSVPEQYAKNIEIESTSWGGLSVKSGDNFHVKIANGESSVESKKQDLDIDDVYQAEYLVNDEKAILYKRHIPGVEIEEYHFYLVVETPDGYYEIENSKDDIYSLKEVETMFESAKQLQFI